MGPWAWRWRSGAAGDSTRARGRPSGSWKVRAVWPWRVVVWESIWRAARWDCHQAAAPVGMAVTGWRPAMGGRGVVISGPFGWGQGKYRSQFCDAGYIICYNDNCQDEYFEGGALGAGIFEWSSGC